MADKNFFDLLKDKMAALRPSEKHRDDDWNALAGHLNAALPQQPRKRRRTLLLPLLLCVALLSSNAVWWHSSRNDQARMAQLEAQTTSLQHDLSELGKVMVSTKTTHLRDTLWRTVYVRVRAEAGADWTAHPAQSAVDQPMQAAASTDWTEKSRTANSTSGATREASTGIAQPPEAATQVSSVLKFAMQNIDNQGRSAPAHWAVPLDSMGCTADLAPLPLPGLSLLPLPQSAASRPNAQAAKPPEPEKPTTPFSQKIGGALRPKFFKIGANAGWLYALSKGLMHEGGYALGVQGQVGLSRHWGLSAACTMGRFHYKAHDPAAILGAPDLPMLPSSNHHYTELDVTGQRLRQLDLGLRYTFSQPGRPRPYLGMGWASQTLLPFMVEYEIQHETYGPVTKGQHRVSASTRLRNHFGLSAGLELPLSARASLTLEGFAQRQWKKPSRTAPDLAGFRAGAHWLF